MHPPAKRFSWRSNIGVECSIENPGRPPAKAQSETQTDSIKRKTKLIYEPRSSSAQPQSRPRTSPLSIAATQRVDSTPNRPKTAIIPHSRQTLRCERVEELFHEPTRCHKLCTHTRTRRTKSAPHSGRTLNNTNGMVTHGPGYTLNKNTNNYSMFINTEEFFNRDEIPGTTRKYEDHSRDQLIADLQEQISSLSLLLEEEKAKHRQTRLKASDKLKEKLAEQAKEHIAALELIQVEHNEATELQRVSHEKEFSVYRVSAESQIARMKNENEFLQKAFNTFKGTLNSDMDERWAKMEEDLSLKHKEEMYTTINDIKTQLIQEHTEERTHQMKEVQKKIERIRAEHNSEIQMLQKRFSNVAADLTKLKKTSQELQETRSELQMVREDHKKTCQQLTQLTNCLTDTRLQLSSYEEHFQEKVQEVAEKYRHQMDDIRSQNTELRRMYTKKCSEIFDEKAETEKERIQRIQTTRDTMKELISIRHRSDVSLVSDSKTNYSKSRRSSVPITSREVTKAEKSAGAARSPSDEMTSTASAGFLRIT